MSVGFREVLDEDYLKYQLAEAQYLGEGLVKIGFQIIQPPGGHAIYIDAAATLPHISPSQYPGQTLAVEFYRAGGIRTCEIGSVMFGKPAEDGQTEIPSQMELVRFALPRRTHTQSHIDYVIEIASDVFNRKDELTGFKIIEQPPRLRHFTAKFAPC